MRCRAEEHVTDRLCAGQFAHTKAVRDGVPSLMPASRRIARATFSMVRISSSTVRRAASRERQRSQALAALDVNRPEQPARVIYVNARASFLSVLFGRFHRRIGSPRLDADRRQAFGP